MPILTNLIFYGIVNSEGKLMKEVKLDLKEDGSNTLKEIRDQVEEKYPGYMSLRIELIRRI